MTEFYAWLEQSGFGTFVRESSSLLAYPTFLFLHTFGLSLLVGLNAALDLHLLGLAPRAPMSPFLKFFPLMWLGFWINALSGAALFVADASAKAKNPVFGIKLAFVAAAVVVMMQLKKRLRDPDLDSGALPSNLKVLGFISLLL